MKKALVLLMAVLASMLMFTPSASAGGTNRQSDTVPFWGGDLIQHSTTKASGWFMMHHGTSGYYGGTANEFSNQTFKVGATTTTWGTTEHWNYTGDTNAAAQLVALSHNAANKVFADPNTIANRQVYSWATTDQDVVGNTVCASSADSLEVCNMLDTNDDISFTTPDSKVWQHQVQIRCPVQGIGCINLDNRGDMGAPVYAICTVSPCVDKVEAVGMLIGTDVQCSGSVCWQYGYYSPVRFIMSWYQASDPGINILCTLCTDS